MLTETTANGTKKIKQSVASMIIKILQQETPVVLAEKVNLVDLTYQVKMLMETTVNGTRITKTVVDNLTMKILQLQNHVVLAEG